MVLIRNKISPSSKCLSTNCTFVLKRRGWYGELLTRDMGHLTIEEEKGTHEWQNKEKKLWIVQKRNFMNEIDWLWEIIFRRHTFFSHVFSQKVLSTRSTKVLFYQDVAHLRHALSYPTAVHAHVFLDQHNVFRRLQQQDNGTATNQGLTDVPRWVWLVSSCYETYGRLNYLK